MRCTPAGAVNARAQPVAEMQAAWYHWRLRTRRRHSRLGGCRAALDAIGFGPRLARRFGRVSDKPLSAPSWPTCTMSGRPATVAISPKHLWRCSSPTAIMLSSPQSAAASRHRRTRRRSPPLHGTLPGVSPLALPNRTKSIGRAVDAVLRGGVARAHEGPLTGRAGASSGALGPELTPDPWRRPGS